MCGRTTVYRFEWHRDGQTRKVVKKTYKTLYPPIKMNKINDIPLPSYIVHVGPLESSYHLGEGIYS